MVCARTTLSSVCKVLNFLWIKSKLQKHLNSVHNKNNDTFHKEIISPATCEKTDTIWRFHLCCWKIPEVSCIFMLLQQADHFKVDFRFLPSTPLHMEKHRCTAGMWRAGWGSRTGPSFFTTSANVCTDASRDSRMSSYSRSWRLRQNSGSGRSILIL